MQRNAGKRDKPIFSSPYFTDIYVFMLHVLFHIKLT